MFYCPPVAVVPIGIGTFRAYWINKNNKLIEQAANDTLCDVQDGKISEDTLLKYLDGDKKQHDTDYELADFCRGGDLSDDD